MTNHPPDFSLFDPDIEGVVVAARPGDVEGSAKLFVPGNRRGCAPIKAVVI